MNTLSKRVGKRILAIRVSRRLSQEQLAERAGVSYKFIGDVERGTGNPTVNWLESVAHGLGVPVMDFLADEEPAAVPYPPLSGRDYVVVRDAKKALDEILARYVVKTSKSKARPRRTPNREGRR